MRRLSTRMTIGVVTGALILAGCGGNDEPGEQDTAVVAANLLEEVNEAIASLVAAGHSTDDLTVLRAEAVTWSDASLGCPKPGRVYTQALVEGYRIIVDTPDGEKAFHAATGEPPALCTTPKPPAS
jgi:hypothetical protein